MVGIFFIVQMIYVKVTKSNVGMVPHKTQQFVQEKKKDKIQKH